jgi:hypothetical protein
MTEGKVILDLCGGTGAWSKPYKDAGYDVRLITLPDNDVRLYIPPENVYGILAAPPCTAFSMMRNFWGGPTEQRFIEGLETVSACTRIILVSRPKFWALENPKGYLRRFIGLPTWTFNPYYYGDNYPKITDLWGRFNVPLPQRISRPEGLVKFAHIASKDIHPEYCGKLTRQERRSITPPGFAKAFFEANR